MFMLPISGNCRVSGEGNWAIKHFALPKYVTITQVRIYSDASNFTHESVPEIEAYFGIGDGPGDWRPDVYSMIVTDPQWLLDFRDLLSKEWFSKQAASELIYSEVYLQGADYVHLITSSYTSQFVRELDPMYRFVLKMPTLP